MANFTLLNEEAILEMILSAKERIVFVAPGITLKVSEAIGKNVAILNGSVEIIIDSNPEVCRIGYGEIEGIDFLMNNGITVKKVNSLRIGLFIVDNKAIIYSPTPLIVEDESSKRINAILVTMEQAEVLVNEIKESYSEGPYKYQTSIFDEDIPPFVPEPYTTNELTIAKEDLEERPPKKFDLERKVQVYKSYFQFVELSLTGIHFSRRTVTIPSKLIAVSGDREVQEKLKTTYKLINENSTISGKEIEEKVATLRKTYTRSMGKRLGSVILVSNKEEFTKKVEEIKVEIESFSKEVKDKLQAELDLTKAEIFKILLPGIMDNPPDDLRLGINTPKPKEKFARKYLEEEIEKFLPNIGNIISEMKLDCDFKDVTYEMLNDKDFQGSLTKQFPYLELKLPYEDFEAIGVKS
jgi:hypothetical protein